MILRYLILIKNTLRLRMIYLLSILFFMLIGTPMQSFSITTAMAQQVIAHLNNPHEKNTVPFWKEYVTNCRTSNTAPDFEAFLEQVFLWYAAQDPEMLSHLGLFEQLGIREHNAHLTDVSPECALQDIAEHKELLEYF